MPEQEKPKVKKTINKQNAATYYSNSVQLETSQWDLRFRFRRFNEANNEEVVIDELAVVYLSLPQAKALLAVFSKQLAEYEKEYGTIPAFGAAAKSPPATKISVDVEEG
jgi:hypothetical protein